MEPLDTSERNVPSSTPRHRKKASLEMRSRASAVHVVLLVLFYKSHTWRQDALTFWPIQLCELGVMFIILFYLHFDTSLTAPRRQKSSQQQYVLWYTYRPACLWNRWLRLRLWI